MIVHMLQIAKQL